MSFMSNPLTRDARKARTTSQADEARQEEARQAARGTSANSENGHNGSASGHDSDGDWVSRLSPEAQRASKQYLSEAAALGIVPHKMPQHIAVIMDGNRRWAKDRGWMIIAGHSTGAGTTRDVIHTCAGLKIPALTLYTFSTENWRRPAAEVVALMRLITRNLRQELQTMHEHNIRIQHIGRRDGLPRYLLRQIDQCVESTRKNTGMVLSLALNYGGRAEIADALRAIIKNVQAGMLRAEDVTEEHITQALYTAGLPEPDLMIRTGGELRISNFLPWQIAYAELWVTPVLWPDFTKHDLYSAIVDFQKRERRFGASTT
jgi:undecaprenyl diphosphate synthase